VTGGARRLLGRLVVTACIVLAGSSVPTAAAAGEPIVDDTAEIRLLTKSSGGGAHPVLKWKPVAGTASYLVVVRTPGGTPFWTWQGSETSVRLGGGPESAADDTEGAALRTRMVWFVIAFDADRKAIASSVTRRIRP
jgi:hypothetical protein